jgi:hypothetical protein
MTDHLPEFESDDEIEAFFDSADLDELDLQEALEIQIATHVGLVVEGPCEMVETGSAATTSSGHIDAPGELVPY